MARLEDLTRGAQVNGLHASGPVTVVDVRWHGAACVEVTYKDPSGKPQNELLFRDREASLDIVAPGQAWSFEADGGLLRLVSEAYRIHLAHLFDPLLAVHTSILDPLPHQITGVYGEMLPRQPLRFLLADDPGAGKTIMAGLLIRELRIRGDVHRCLIVCPGNLVEQWQDEMRDRFGLDFEPITRARLEESPDAFRRYPFVVCRLDQLSRNEDVQAKLQDDQADWDLVIVDEAHKMSAHFFGGEIKETKRYKLGKLLGGRARHFLLLTATPHNGKEEDFQLFLALLDADRFEGRFRDGVHVVDPSDLMRRLVKETLLKFDGTPFFPERWAYTANYRLSDLDAQLYKEVTAYVQEGMNRAERLARESEGRRGNLVGWALTILQRRLASSPHAIAESLRRRRERLERRLREEQLLRRGAEVALDTTQGLDDRMAEDPDDLDEAPAAEVEATTDLIIERYRQLLRQGAILVDPNDPGETPRALFYLEHEILDGRTDRQGNRLVASKQLQFVELTPTGAIRSAGYAPYLDYRPPTDKEKPALQKALSGGWARADLEAQVTSYAIQTLVPGHLKEVKDRREDLVQKVMAAVKDRLTKEINYWDHRANVLRDEEMAGRANARMNSAKARQRADDLQARLLRRMQELEQERQLSPRPPVAIGGALVIPIGLLQRAQAVVPTEPPTFAKDRQRIADLAMAKVMETEQALGRVPRDVHEENRVTTSNPASPAPAA